MYIYIDSYKMVIHIYIYIYEHTCLMNVCISLYIMSRWCLGHGGETKQQAGDKEIFPSFSSTTSKEAMSAEPFPKDADSSVKNASASVDVTAVSPCQTLLHFFLTVFGCYWSLPAPLDLLPRPFPFPFPFCFFSPPRLHFWSLTHLS